MTDSRTLDLLLEDVAREGRALTNYLHSNSFYQPCFRPGGLGEYPELPYEVQESRRKLQEAAKAVHDLAAGPAGYMSSLGWSVRVTASPTQIECWRLTSVPKYHDSATLRWLVHFRIPEAVPLVGAVSYAQVAHTCDVDESFLRRIVRYAMLNNLFYEPSPDEVAHTPFSAVLVTDATISAMKGHHNLLSFPACTEVVEAYEKWGPSEEPNQNAFSLAYGTDLPMFQYLSQPGFEEKADRFARLMAAVNLLPSHDFKYTVEGYHWKSAKGTIVDIGGSTGETAIALARAYPDLPPIIVEDLVRNVEKGQASLPEGFKDRVFFTAHDFFEPHPESVISAQLFVLRLVLHDYSDKYARRILRNILPALKNGATLVVIDPIMPPPGRAPLEVERVMRRMDMEMMQMLSGKEREMEDWEDLFRSADKSLIVRNVNQPVGSAMGIMEVVYDG